MDKVKKMFLRFSDTYEIKDKPRPDFDYLVVNKNKRKLYLVIQVRNYKSIKPLLTRLKENADKLKAKLVIACKDPYVCEKDIVHARKLGVSIFDQKWMDYFIGYETKEKTPRTYRRTKEDKIRQMKSRGLQDRLSEGII